jgi:hypothetical protein
MRISRPRTPSWKISSVFSVAISGDTLAVGALFESSNGLGGEADNSALNAAQSTSSIDGRVNRA